MYLTVYLVFLLTLFTVFLFGQNIKLKSTIKKHKKLLENQNNVSLELATTDQLLKEITTRVKPVVILRPKRIPKDLEKDVRSKIGDKGEVFGLEIFSSMIDPDKLQRILMVCGSIAKNPLPGQKSFNSFDGSLEDLEDEIEIEDDQDIE